MSDKEKDNAIATLFEDLQDIKDLVAEVRDTLKALLELLKGAETNPEE